ncbi:cation acetate symporter [Haloglycomyces albus]|uniref:sodium/solute symporter n=1 Tax=Haloglycomyces albus TaxID=526067 RepID=UPI0004AEC98E|nr:cation acetate symporter [Haloglycomyces albus]
MAALSVIAAVVAASLLLGLFAVRTSTTKPDFLIASRRIVPGWNATAIAGEYISAASALGLAGMVWQTGIGAMWYAVGFTAGYVLIAQLTAGPMRRSGAYTVPDFAEFRLRSVVLRRFCGVVGAVIVLLYLVPQFKAAGVVLQAVSGLPYAVGVVASGCVVAGTVVWGGIRSATYVQAFHYLVKLAFIAVPGVYLWWSASPRPRPDLAREPDLLISVAGTGPSLWATLSILVATTVGAVGLPHVIMRFHTSPGARTARRTAVGVIVLLGVFYLFPAVYGFLSRLFVPTASEPDLAVLRVAERLDPSGIVLAVVAAGAFAAFLSTSSGLLVALASSVTHDLFAVSLRRLRLGVVAGSAVAVVLAVPTATVDINILVGWSFTLAASSFCPLLVLGIWWRGLTVSAAASGMAVGGLLTLGCAAATVVWDVPVTVAYPALWLVPSVFAVMLVLSRCTRPPVNACEAVLFLHLPRELSR